LRCGTESLLAEMITAGRIMTGTEYCPLEIRFRHARPRDTSAHEAFFKSNIVWSAPRSEIVIDSKLNEMPLVKADPALAAFFERHANDLLERFGLGDGAAQKVRSVLADDLRRGLPTLECVAARLAMSARTLRRRLQEEGTTFQDVLDEVR